MSVGSVRKCECFDWRPISHGLSDRLRVRFLVAEDVRECVCLLRATAVRSEDAVIRGSRWTTVSECTSRPPRCGTI